MSNSGAKTLDSKRSAWELTNETAEDVTAELPPSQGFTISHANNSIIASPRKADNEPVTGKDTKKAATSSSSLFKPYEIPMTFTRELKMNNSKSFPPLYDLQRRIIQIEKSLYPYIPETPGVGSIATLGVLQQDGSDDSQPEEKLPPEIAPIKTESSNWQKPQKLYYPKATPPDVALEERPNVMSNNYKANNIY
ncbi:hypothetical protein BC332_20462 [Capsicum chinense]|nr:hypothetical protein BC332_20462 [Capsicum chinense]